MKSSDEFQVSNETLIFDLEWMLSNRDLIWSIGWICDLLMLVEFAGAPTSARARIRAFTSGFEGFGKEGGGSKSCTGTWLICSKQILSASGGLLLQVVPVWFLGLGN